MDTLKAAYGDQEEEDGNLTHRNSNSDDNNNKNGRIDDGGDVAFTDQKPSATEVNTSAAVVDAVTTLAVNPSTAADAFEVQLMKDATAIVSSPSAELEAPTIKEEQLGSEDMSSDSTSDDEQSQNPQTDENRNAKSTDNDDGDDEEEEDRPMKKQKPLSLFTPEAAPFRHKSDFGSSSQSQLKTETPLTTNGKKSKKKSKNNNVWTKPTSRKGKKKTKNNNNSGPKPEDKVLITPVPRLPDKNDDSSDMKICLSKIHKAEKVELSEDRLSAGSCKGYRMVRATRGVTEGVWYFEIKLVFMGESGHTRLGWSTEKGDLQAPVGYDANSFGYRDIDGCKIHKALREKYGEEGYKEGDVIGFYINLPEGNLYMPKPPQLVLYKGQRYLCAPDAKEDPPKTVPGSEIIFFKNGVCQGVAFRDLYGGRYFPAASMYTLPNQPNCLVKFNFGPDFECLPKDFESYPMPRPMIEVPYLGNGEQLEQLLTLPRNVSHPVPHYFVVGKQNCDNNG
ncbi:hypothetical protein Ancab_024661 [Ancistrocladus abbreviatus]